jgi:hypothetical protein
MYDGPLSGGYTPEHRFFGGEHKFTDMTEPFTSKDSIKGKRAKPTADDSDNNGVQEVSAAVGTKCPQPMMVSYGAPNPEYIFTIIMLVPTKPVQASEVKRVCLARAGTALFCIAHAVSGIEHAEVSFAL